MKIAVIDLGTNTFHMVIYQVKDQLDTYQEVGRLCIDVRLGEKGLSKEYITDEAYQRALVAMENFQALIRKEQVDNVYAIGTSALRNAKNGRDIAKKLEEKTGIAVAIISGEQEASLIYQGVRAAVKLDQETAVMMDIGGGSVEFIISDDKNPLWQRSFEIGAQRLVDQFHQEDPISEAALQALRTHLANQLQPLFAAAASYHPTRLVGSSGAFVTLMDIYVESKQIKLDPSATAYDFPIQEFQAIYQRVCYTTRQERLQIPGLSNQRIDMIVVSSSLIAFVIDNLHLQHLTTSRYALKEGMLLHALQAIRQGQPDKALWFDR